MRLLAKAVITLWTYSLVPATWLSSTSIFSPIRPWGAYVKDCGLSLHIGHYTLKIFEWLRWISIFARMRKEGWLFGIRPSLMVAVKAALFYVLEIAQPHFTRRDSTADGTIRTLSRIDRALINLPTAEARDVHCYSHVFENLGKRCIPSDHAAVRVVIQKPTIRDDQAKRIPSWMSKHPVLCSILKQINDDHQYPDDPFVALAEFKTILERQTPNSSGAKLLTASHCITNLRKQALGYADALRRSVSGNLSENECFDQCSFECIDFHGFTQIITILIRERIADREAEIRNISAGQETKGCHSLAPRRITKAGLCQNQLLHVFPEFLGQSVAFALHRFCLKCALFDADGKRQSADLLFAPGAPRSRCSVFTKLLMKMATLSGKWRRIGQEAMWILGYDFWSAYQWRAAPLPWNYPAVCSQGSWRHTFRIRQNWIWWTLGHKKGICSRPRWDSV